MGYSPSTHGVTRVAVDAFGWLTRRRARERVVVAATGSAGPAVSEPAIGRGRLTFLIDKQHSGVYGCLLTASREPDNRISGAPAGVPCVASWGPWGIR